MNKACKFWDRNYNNKFGPNKKKKNGYSRVQGGKISTGCKSILLIFHLNKRTGSNIICLSMKCIATVKFSM